ncbi:hypothetical protein L7F22_049016 [Adiantum nelumboides]|nr:hypothetical protein [Adiantum nelumboides]
MYFCPYPRGYENAPPRGTQQQVSPPRMRPPPIPMCEQQQQPQQHQPIQILRQLTYAPVPQPTTEVPPLPHDGVEGAMNVISCEDKGEEKIMEAEAMPGKQATIAKEPRQMTTNDGTNKKEKKRKKKASMTRRKIGIINFPMKSKPQDLIEEVQRQEPKLTWPQLLHLSPRMWRQWSKMVSTRRSKSVNTLKAQVLEDDVTMLDTQIKGQRVSSDYVDGGEQVCVISEKMMHKLRLEVSGPSGFKGNDVSAKYVGVVTVCGIQFGVDMYVLPARGEGYPIILGRPWLIAMNVRQDWESRTLLLKPPRKKGKSIQTIVYNVKEGRKESSELETSEDEWSTEDSSSTAEVTSSVNDSESEKSSLLEAMGVVPTRPTTQDGGSIKETLSDEKIEDILSTDLSKKERKEFEVMLQKHSPLFILDYKQIKGVTVVQGTCACKNSKLLQWLDEVKLLMKDFEAIRIQHISRQHNKEADNMANTQFEVMVGAIKFKEPLFQGQETMEDILYFLETSECPKHLERFQRHRLVRKALSYQLIGEYLYHKGKDFVLRRVPLVKEIETILLSCHDGVCGGHFAQEITIRKILQAGFVWPSLYRDVQHWCKACKACQQAGDRKLSYGPRFPIFAYGPFEKWGIDAIGPLPRTSMGKQYILTATDYMTRWAEAASVARITATDVSKFVLDYICSRFGTPLEILSDRGPGFRADLLDALLENLSIKHVHSTPYYPQCNGLVEKTNGVLCKIITKNVRDRPQDSDKHLIAALWAYRTSFKVSTQFTPYHLVYGQEVLLPIEVELGSLRVLARETTSSKEKLEQRILDLQRLELDREAATDYYITQANKKREEFNNKVKEKKLEEGKLVMRYDSRLDLSHSKKFLQRWEGPYVIFKKFKNGSYRLQDLSDKIHKYPVNGWRLKEFFQRIQPIQEERQVSLDA